MPSIRFGQQIILPADPGADLEAATRQYVVNRTPADPVAATAGLRTLGTGATQACAGADSRLTDAREPTGTASGDLAGTYPSPTIRATLADPVAGTAGLRTLGTGAAQACAGNDARLSDSRAPNGTASGCLNGTYPSPALDVVPWAHADLVDAAPVATDASLSNHFRVTIAADRSLGAPTNPTDGQRAIWEVTASGGARTLTPVTTAGGFAYGSDITALSAIVSGKTDYIGAIYHSGADRWRIIAYVKGY